MHSLPRTGEARGREADFSDLPGVTGVPGEALPSPSCSWSGGGSEAGGEPSPQPACSLVPQLWLSTSEACCVYGESPEPGLGLGPAGRGSRQGQRKEKGCSSDAPAAQQPPSLGLTLILRAVTGLWTQRSPGLSPHHRPRWLRSSSPSLAWQSPAVQAGGARKALPP